MQTDDSNSGDAATHSIVEACSTSKLIIGQLEALESPLSANPTRLHATLSAHHWPSPTPVLPSTHKYTAFTTTYTQGQGRVAARKARPYCILSPY